MHSSFEKNIIAIYQDQGKKWLEQLTKLLSKLEESLEIAIKKPFDNLSYNYTAPAIDKNGKELVIKCAPKNISILNEISALQFYNGQAAVQLYAANPDEGWLLLERCQPGKDLTSLPNDNQACEIACSVMQKLWKPTTDEKAFPSIKDWLSQLKATPSIPKKLIEPAITISNELLSTQGTTVLLHGDLHHYNILSSQREPWLAIDPKGVIGEREYEIGAFMRNPKSLQLSKKQLRNRIEVFTTNTGLDRQRIISWSFVQAVLAAVWCVEDKVDGVKDFLSVAELFYLEQKT